MLTRNHSDRLSALLVTAALGIPALVQAALADVITSISVGPDQALIYPSDLSTLPDEHVTFFPPVRRPRFLFRHLRSRGVSGDSTSYLVFASSNILGGPAGTVALETSDLKNFGYASEYSNPVMVPPVSFVSCSPTYDTEFDENYAAPGSVLQDPTRSAGHFIMIYEAENHCPGRTWEFQFYATTGFARSSDYGRTWPAPVDSEFGHNDRRPVLKLNIPEPTTAPTSPINMGNGIPAAFIDMTMRGEHYIYITYLFTGTGADGYLRMARAKLEFRETGLQSKEPDARPARPVFKKWYMGSFNQPGLGGLDSGVTPSRGCTGTNGEAQLQGSISYLATTEQYLLTFVCLQLQLGTPGMSQPYQAGWYYSTATSLEKQDWTTPRLITNSLFAVTPACSFGAGGTFDGWYPSFMSPFYPPGRLGTTGQVFFLNGCDSAGSGRLFVSRAFTITTGP